MIDSLRKMYVNNFSNNKYFVIRFLGRELFWLVWLYFFPVIIILVYMGSHTLIFGEGPFGNRFSLGGLGLFFWLPLFYWGIVYCCITPFRWVVTVWKHYYDKNYESKIKAFEPIDEIERFETIKIRRNHTSTKVSQENGT